MIRPPRVVLILLALSVAAPAQTISYRLHTQQEVMDRLKLAAAKNEDRQATLKKLFADESCTGDRLTEQPVKHQKLGNVICTLPGETGDVILVSAHFDHVSRGMGVTDNWSGASLLPSLLYGISSSPRAHTYIFVGFTAEEEGEIGSQFYASHLTKDELAKLRAVINIDTLGLGQTEVWASHADPELMKDLLAVATAIKASVVGMNVDNVGSSDSEAFARYKVPRMTLHSVTTETLPILHSERDQVSAIKPNDYYTSYKLITAFLVYLDAKLPPTSNQPGANASGDQRPADAISTPK